MKEMGIDPRHPLTRVEIIEVGPRDGLQNEPGIVPLETKVAFIDALSRTGVREVEVSSFVRPEWVPQLADAAEVFARIERREGVVYSALVPNERGLDRAMAVGVDKVAVFTAASETFSQRNTNASIDATIERFRPVVARAAASNLPVRGYVSCIVRCPYEGPIAPAQVREVAARLLEIGIDEIDLGETLGVGEPADIERVYDGLRGLLEPCDTVLHLHDTRGKALACASRALELGVRRFDASCGGIGGCPYAPGAAGNVATEDLADLCQREGFETGLDMDALRVATQYIATAVGRPLRREANRIDGPANGVEAE